MPQDKQVIVITGSSGRIGTRLIARFQEKYQTVGLDFIGITSPYPSMEFVYVDLGSDHSVECAFNRIRYAYGNRISSIIHLAAFYSFEGTHLELYDKITVQGTRRVLDQARKFQVEQFIFTSTMLVHDPSPRGVIQNEDSRIHGKWAYPESKVKTEELIKEHHGNIPYVIIRIAGCYDDECNSIPISQHMNRIYEKQSTSLVFPGNADNGVPYLHFDDLTDMIEILYEGRKELPKDLILLSCEEDSITYRDLQTNFGKLIHGVDHWPMARIPKGVAVIGAYGQNMNPFHKPFIKPWMISLADDNYQFSMDKSRKILGWTPKRSLRETLPKLVENLKADPIAWYKRHKIPLSRYVLKQEKRK